SEAAAGARGGGARLRVVARPGPPGLLHPRGARGLPSGAPPARAREPGERPPRPVPGRARLPRGGPADRGGPRAAPDPARSREPARVRVPARVAGRRRGGLGQSLRAPPRDALRHRAPPAPHAADHHRGRSRRARRAAGPRGGAAMKQVLLERYGAPAEAVRCVDVPDVGAPAAGEVVFDVLAFPINPADLSMCRGTYRLRPALPAGIGAECVGRVAAVGAGVTHVRPGDRVINLQRDNWTQRRRVKGDDVIPVPAGLDDHQAAMLRINPPTALLLLSDLVALRPGDWVVQNVANSAVGR